MLNQPMIEKLLAMRVNGMVEALKAQEQDRAVNERVSWNDCAASGSAMELARERGAGAETESGQAERISLCGRHRHRAAQGLDKSCDAGFGQRLCLGAQSREHFRNRDEMAWARATSPRRWLRKRVGMATQHSICALLPSRANWLWPAPMAAYATAARLARIDVLVIDDWEMAPLNEAERREVGKSARIVIRLATPSSLPSCRSRAGTSRSAIPPSPTASSIA